MMSIPSCALREAANCPVQEYHKDMEAPLARAVHLVVSTAI